VFNLNSKCLTYIIIFIPNNSFKIKYHKIKYMALLKEDTAFTHVIAIDFGTGASGYLTYL
jgi:hypothetical protein